MSVPGSTPPELTDTDLAGLRRTFSGDLVRPTDAAYPAARRVWNGMIDRHPALVARCQDAGDVAAALRFGRERDLPVAVRGGGHNVAGFGTCDGGLVLDLSGMRAVSLNAEARTATVGPGHTWGTFDAATATAGLATTGGLVSGTGIAGFTLGGGLGWLMRRHGLACDNLLSAEVVMADGERVLADETHEADLIWGLRGGGGNFGVVTSFTFGLHPVSTILRALLIFPAERAREVLDAFVELTSTAPDDLTSLAAFITAPPAPFVPAELQGRPAIAIVACHLGEPAAVVEPLRGLRRLGPATDVLGPVPYTALQTELDEGAEAGLRNYWKSGYLAALEPGFLDRLAERAPTAPAPWSQVHLHHMGGAVARVPVGATAFAHRDAAFVLNVVGTWEDPAEDDANVAWVRGAWDALQPWTDGVYVNFLGSEGDERVRAAYGEPTYARLAALKRRYDPDNVFRINQNVRPAAEV